MGRFLSKEDMLAIKKAEQIRNSMVKRDIYKRSNHTDIQVCGCGSPGCHFEYNVIKTQE